MAKEESIPLGANLQRHHREGMIYVDKTALIYNIGKEIQICVS